MRVSTDDADGGKPSVTRGLYRAFQYRLERFLVSGALYRLAVIAISIVVIVAIFGSLQWWIDGAPGWRSWLAALWFSGPERGRWRHGALLGLVAGMLFFLVNLAWITEISRVAGTVFAGLTALVLLSLYLSLYFAAFGAFAATVGRWSPGELAPGKKKSEDLFGQSL